MRTLPHILVIPVAVSGLLMAASGCSTSTSPSKTEAVNAALSEVGSAQSVVSTAVMAGGAVMPATTVAPSTSRCPYDSGTGHFVCASATMSGVTFTSWYELLDASGHRQTAFDSSTTAAIHTVMDMSGTLAAGTPPGSVTKTRHSDQTLSGLLTGTHTLNGTGNSTTSFATVDLTSSITESDTINNLVLPAASATQKFPLSGSIDTTFGIGGGPGGTAFQSTLTFNGTSVATMVTTTGGITQTCSVGLGPPTVFGPCH
jgi:hypothetical protein